MFSPQSSYTGFILLNPEKIFSKTFLLRLVKKRKKNEEEGKKELEEQHHCYKYDFIKEILITHVSIKHMKKTGQSMK